MIKSKKKNSGISLFSGYDIN